MTPSNHNRKKSGIVLAPNSDFKEFWHKEASFIPVFRDTRMRLSLWDFIFSAFLSRLARLEAGFRFQDLFHGIKARAMIAIFAGNLSYFRSSVRLVLKKKTLQHFLCRTIHAVHRPTCVLVVRLFQKPDLSQSGQELLSIFCVNTSVSVTLCHRNKETRNLGKHWLIVAEKSTSLPEEPN